MSASSRMVKERNDAACKASKLVEHFNDRLAHEGPMLVDGYVKGQFKLAFRRRSPWDKQQYGFVVWAAHPPVSRDGHKRGDSRIPRSNLESLWVDWGHEQPSVLAQDVEVMEGPKQFIPSLIRLQVFDGSTFKPWENLYEFRAFIHSIPPMLGRFGHGEVSIFGLRHAVAVSQCGCEQIQTAAQKVDVNPSFNLKSERQCGLSATKNEIALRWRVQLFDNHFDVFSAPGCQVSLEEWDMGYGPINAGLSV